MARIRCTTVATQTGRGRERWAADGGVGRVTALRQSTVKAMLARSGVWRR
jgi:hypothetical protein